MKILFLSSKGDSFPLAMEMMKQNHAVKFYVKSKDDKDAGSGFVERVDDYTSFLGWADLVVTDDTGWGSINESIRKMGIPVVGGTKVSDALEEDRGAGQKMFKALGMDTLESREFKSSEEAVAYVSENPRRYVIKVSGKSDDKALTYVGQCDGGEDVLPVLEHMAKKKGADISSIEIQDHTTGVEVAIGGFFNGKDFLDPVNVNFEHKRLCNGGFEGGQAGLGPNTGEMGTYLYHRDKGFKLYRETLELFVPVLKKEGYVGYFDINLILEFDPFAECQYRIRPLEMTNRFGWPLLLLQLETMKINDLGDLFLRMAKGKATDFKVSFPHSVCVVVGVPPLPFIDKDIADKMSNGMPIIFKNPDDTEGVYPGDAICEDGQWICQGEKGYACVCAAGGDSVEEARSKAYSRAYNIVVPNKIYRTDIAELSQMKLDQIKSLLQHEAPAEIA